MELNEESERYLRDRIEAIKQYDPKLEFADIDDFIRMFRLLGKQNGAEPHPDIVTLQQFYWRDSWIIRDEKNFDLFSYATERFIAIRVCFKEKLAQNIARCITQMYNDKDIIIVDTGRIGVFSESVFVEFADGRFDVCNLHSSRSNLNMSEATLTRWSDDTTMPLHSPLVEKVIGVVVGYYNYTRMEADDIDTYIDNFTDIKRENINDEPEN